MRTQPAKAAAGAGVLVVDDAADTRRLTCGWLRDDGYDVTEAVTGAEAIAVLGELTFDIVLVGVDLPDMSGFDVCEWIKGNPDTAAVPVINISATAVEVEDKEQGLRRGADAYLVEPIDPRELLATVQAALRYHRARADAVRLARRLTQLTEITLVVNTATTFDEVLAAAAAGAATLFGAPATVLTVTPRGMVRAATSDGGSELPEPRTEPVGTLDDVRAVVLEDRHGALAAAVGDFAWHPSATASVVMSRPQPSATPVCVAVDASATPADEDRNLLLQFGQVTALACESLRSLSEEHTLALKLQHSLLPRGLPEDPRMEMVARYVPASRNAEIGGDFYEVAELDGRLLIAIGDVSGHSIEAAMVMGEVRHALRAYAVEGHGPVAILDRLDAMVRRFHPRGLTTLCLMFVDSATGVAEIANAGHIPPLVADGEGIRYLTDHGPLLGIGLPRPAATTMTLSPGTLVLLVTDGLIEHRTRSIDEGMAAVADVVTRDGDLDALCDRLLHRLGQEGEDDIAILAFRRR